MEVELERELEIGHQIQASFLPEEIPQIPGWEIATRFQPARQVAGDFYDLFPLVQNRRLGLVVGDVCDKGVGAALFMALFRTLIRAFAQQHYALRWMDSLEENDPAGNRPHGRPALPPIGASALKNAIELTNNYIAATHGRANMFATVFLGVLDPTDGLLLYVNAGHVQPIVVDASGIKHCLQPTGPLVGILPEARFEIQSVRLAVGDTLVAFTDGVTEAQNSAGELFESERLYRLAARPVSTANALLDSILAGLQAFIGEAPPSDDIALLAIRRFQV